MAAAAPSAALVAFAECFSGGVGGWFSSFVLFPLDVVKTRMQGGEEGSALQVAGRLYKRGGLVALWKGGHARGLQSLIEKVGYFYSYSFMKTLIERSGPMGVALQLTVGYFANWVHMPVSMPFDTIVIRMTTSGDSLGSVLSRARSEPFTNLYKGVMAFLVLGLKNAAQFAVYEPTKRWQIARNGGAALTPLQAFVHGAFSRLVSDTVLFPARRAKVLQQQDRKGGADSSSDGKPAATMLGVLRRLVKEKGPLAIFAGLGPELVRGMLSGALMLMVKEYIDAIVMGAILGRSAAA